VRMSKEIIPIERIARAILVIRSAKVMLDSDLAALYGVTTGNLNKAVKRNAERFPTDFMFQLDTGEVTNLKFQFGISSWGGRRGLPYAFTEQGVAMLSSVLNSDWGGERTRLACWRWRPRHRGLFLRATVSVFDAASGSRFSARRRKEHARRVCYPE
jgi:ORF6N domain